MKAITLTKVQNLLFFVFTILSFTGTIIAQEEEEETKKFSLNGSVDAYFRTNFNGLNQTEEVVGGDVATFDPVAPATSFANDPGFAIGMANLIASYENEKVGFVADLVFGPRGEDAVFLSNPSTNIVNQLYAFYKVNDALKFTIGNFNTFLGYEVISPAANFNYSTSYMFSYGPFSHTGIKADFSFNDNWTGMLAIMNPTDYTEFNPIGKYSFGGQLGYSNDTGSAYLNLLYGEQSLSDDALFQVDLTTGWDLTEAFYLGLNTTYQDTEGVGFYGAAIYTQLALSDSFGVGVRAEYFKELEDGGLVYGADTSVTALTLTGSYEVGGLIIKPEFRFDNVSDDAEPFLTKDLEPSNDLASFLVAAIYAF